MYVQHRRAHVHTYFHTPRTNLLFFSSEFSQSNCESVSEETDTTTVCSLQALRKFLVRKHCERLALQMFFSCLQALGEFTVCKHCTASLRLCKHWESFGVQIYRFVQLSSSGVQGLGGSYLLRVAGATSCLLPSTLCFATRWAAVMSVWWDG